MAEKNLADVLRVSKFTEDRGAVLINTDTKETNYINKEDMAVEISKELGLGDVVTYNVGINDSVLVGNIQGEGVMTYTVGMGVHTEPEGSAFNKNFGTTADTVAEGDHSHNQLISTNSYLYDTLIELGAGETTIIIDVDDLIGVSPNGTTHISPAVAVEVFAISGDVCSKINIDTDNLTVTKTSASVTNGVAHSLSKIEIRTLTASTAYFVTVVFRPGRYIKLTTGGGVRE